MSDLSPVGDSPMYVLQAKHLHTKANDFICSICYEGKPRELGTKELFYLNDEVADWFGKQVFVGDLICPSCNNLWLEHSDSKYFADVKHHRPEINTELWSSLQLCAEDSPCLLCDERKQYKKYRSDPTLGTAKYIEELLKTESLFVGKYDLNDKRKATIKKGDKNRDKNKPEIHDDLLQPIKILSYRSKLVGFYCEVCECILKATNRSSNSAKRHAHSKKHEKNFKSKRPSQSQSFNRSLGQSQMSLMGEQMPVGVGYHIVTKLERDQINDLIALNLIALGKMSQYLVADDWFNEFCTKLINIVGAKPADDDRLVFSRNTLMKKITKQAQNIRAQTKIDIQNARAKNVKFTVTHDDASLNSGNKETIRALSVTWLDEQGLQNRFLWAKAVTDKDTPAIKQSIINAVVEFGIGDNYNLNCDALSSNRSASNQLNKEFTTCGSHATHNILKEGNL